MNATTHTPAPWSFTNKPYDNGNPYIEILAGSGNFLTEDGFRATGIMTEANARLIAAAPELLAACQSALESFGGVRPDDFAKASQSEFDRLTSAIAKATGAELSPATNLSATV